MILRESKEELFTIDLPKYIYLLREIAILSHLA
jgi:hypothetical protein